MPDTQEPVPYLDALIHAKVVNHVLDVALDDTESETDLLARIQQVVPGPVFRLDRGQYTFQIDAADLGPLGDALGDLEGTLRAVAAAETEAPALLDHAAITLIGAIRDAAMGTADHVLTQAVVSAAFAVETARLTAAGLLLGQASTDRPGVQAANETPTADAALDADTPAGVRLAELSDRIAALAAPLAALTAAIDPDGGRAPGLDTVVGDLRALLPDGPVASAKQIADLSTHLGELESRILSAIPSGEKVYTILRQRLEAIQSSSEMILDRMVADASATNAGGGLDPALIARWDEGFDGLLAELVNVRDAIAGAPEKSSAQLLGLENRILAAVGARDDETLAEALSDGVRAVRADLTDLATRVDAVAERLATPAAEMSEGLDGRLDALLGEVGRLEAPLQQGFQELSAQLAAGHDALQQSGAALSERLVGLTDATDAGQELRDVSRMLREQAALGAELRGRMNAVNAATETLLSRLPAGLTRDGETPKLLMALELRLRSLGEAQDAMPDRLERLGHLVRDAVAAASDTQTPARLADLVDNLAAVRTFLAEPVSDPAVLALSTRLTSVEDGVERLVHSLEQSSGTREEPAITRLATVEQSLAVLHEAHAAAARQQSDAMVDVMQAIAGKGTMDEAAQGDGFSHLGTMLETVLQRLDAQSEALAVRADDAAARLDTQLAAIVQRLDRLEERAGANTLETVAIQVGALIDAPSNAPQLERISAGIGQLSHDIARLTAPAEAGAAPVEAALAAMHHDLAGLATRLDAAPPAGSDISDRLDAIAMQLARLETRTSRPENPVAEREGLSRLSAALQSILRRLDMQTRNLEEDTPKLRARLGESSDPGGLAPELAQRLDIIGARLSALVDTPAGIDTVAVGEDLSRMSAALDAALGRIDAQAQALAAALPTHPPALSPRAAAAGELDAEMRQDLRLMLAEFLAQTQRSVLAGDGQMSGT